MYNKNENEIPICIYYHKRERRKKISLSANGKFLNVFEMHDTCMRCIKNCVSHCSCFISICIYTFAGNYKAIKIPSFYLTDFVFSKKKKSYSTELTNKNE